MQTVACENRFFKNRYFRFLQVYYALFGCSRSLLGRSWRPNGSENGSRTFPKSTQKVLQKRIRFSPGWGPILGLFWDPKKERSGGPIFCHFLEPLFGSMLAPSWPRFVSISAPLWPHLRISWPLLASSWPLLAASWTPFGSILALLASLGALLVLSWFHLGTILAHLGCSGPSWLLLGVPT